MKAPSDYKRRVLVSVTGLAPQILTETLYALAKQDPPFIPTEIHVITTVSGAERIRLQLLSEDPGWYSKLVEELDIPKPIFGPDNIHVIKGPNDELLSDIRTPEENECLAKLITNLMQKFTVDDNCAVHASIAGGRKTMGFYLGYAMSLFGRSQDKLSHVLVSPDYEGNPEFFYPTKESKIIYARDARQTPLDTKYAHVELASIPVIPFRKALPSAIRLFQDLSYSEIIFEASNQIKEPVVTLIISKKFIEAEGEEIPLPPSDFTWYHLLAIRRIESQDKDDDAFVSVEDELFPDQYLELYSQVINKNSARYENLEKKFSAMTKFNHFMQQRTHGVKDKLLKKLFHRSVAYEIQGNNPNRATDELKAYRLEIEPENIKIIN